MKAVFAGYLQIVEVKKAMVNASATELILYIKRRVVGMITCKGLQIDR